MRISGITQPINNKYSTFKGEYPPSTKKFYDSFQTSNIKFTLKINDEIDKLYEASLTDRMFAYYEITEANAIFDFTIEKLEEKQAKLANNNSNIIEIEENLDKDTIINSVEFLGNQNKTPKRILYTTYPNIQNSINILGTTNDTATIAKNIVENESTYKADFEYTIKNGQVIRIKQGILVKDGIETVEKESFFNNGDLICIQKGITHDKNGKITAKIEYKFDANTNELVSVRGNIEPNYTNNKLKQTKKVIKTFIDATKRNITN